MFPVAPAASPLDKANMHTFGLLFRKEQQKLQEEANNVSTTMVEDEVEEVEERPTPKKVAPVKTPKGGKSYQRSPY
jgi:hypothetical protein